MDREEKIDRLQNESIKGAKAEKVYENYIKPFTEAKTEILFNAFKDISINDPEALMEIKRTLRTLESLDQEFLNFIDTGKMATQSLSVLMEQEEKH